MKSFLFTFSLIALVSCQNNESEIVVEETTDSLQNISTDIYLVPRWNGNELLCLLNEKGDTVIPFGKYIMSYTDTIREIGILADAEGHWWAVTQSDSILFEVYSFDNEPDPLSEGLFRILKNDKIGFANEKGEIIIEPIYDCAYPFTDGSAKVSLNKALIDIENSEFDTNYSCTDWFYINHEGLKVKPGSLHPLPFQ